MYDIFKFYYLVNLPIKRNENRATTAEAAEILIPNGLFFSIKIKPTQIKEMLIDNKAHIIVNLKFDVFECDFSKFVLAIYLTSKIPYKSYILILQAEVI